MECFTASSVPVISALAMEYALVDHWFSSVPGKVLLLHPALAGADRRGVAWLGWLTGPTEVNRMYVHSGTSHGASSNDIPALARGYPQKPIFQALSEASE